MTQRSKMRKTPSKSKPRTFESMIQAATVLNIPLAILKSAKKRGCPAFKHGRVSASVVGWIKRNPAPDEHPKLSEVQRLQLEKLSKENRKLEFEHQLSIGAYVSIDELKADLGFKLETIRQAILLHTDRSTFNQVMREAKRLIKELDL
jgi:hypothetical protein